MALDKKGLFRRPGSPYVWFKWRDGTGKKRRSSSGELTEEGAAEVRDKLIAAVKGSVPLDTLPTVPAGRRAEKTTRQLCHEVWLPFRQRSQRGRYAWREDRAHLEHHFLPAFGEKPASWLATPDAEMALLDWLVGLPNHTSRRDGKPLAPRTVWNIVSSVRVFLGDLHERRLLPHDVGSRIRWDRHLPPKRDKGETKRRRAALSFQQTLVLASDPRIPAERRVLYALRNWGGGPRPSSEAAVRWQDYEPGTGQLGRITYRQAFDSRCKVIKDHGKTGIDYACPVLPRLAAVLDDWKALGWEAYVGRPPRPQDLILPRPDGTPRRVTTSLVQWHADLDAAG